MPAKKPASGAKIVDVAHPDSVKSDPTSVPIIVKHGPMLKDPMVVERAVESPEDKPAIKAEEKKEEDSPVVTKIELKPVSADERKDEKPKDDKPETNKPAEDVKPPEAAASEEPAAESELKLDEAPKDAKEADAPAEDETETPAATQELLPGAEPTDPAAVKAAREAAEKQLALDKLAAEGTYFLPINAVEKRKVRTFMIVVLLVIVLGAVGFLAALDAGYVHIDGFKAPTNFIKDK